MKDKIVKLKDDQEFYVIDELDYKNRRFIFVVDCNSSTEKVDENYTILEVKMDKENIIVDNIDELDIISTVTNLFLSRLKDI